MTKTPVRRLRRRAHYQSGYFEATSSDKIRKPIPKWIWPLLGGMISLASIVLFLTASPWLTVKEIRIDGQASQATTDELNKLKGQNILWLSVTRPEEKILEEQPSLKDLQILRGIPDTLRIKLIERTPSLIWQIGEDWYTVDPSGIVFQNQTLSKKPDGSLDYPGTNLPVVVDSRNVPVAIGKQAVRPQFIQFVKALKERLPKEANLRLVRVEIGETTFNVTVVTDAGWNVLFDTSRSLDAQMKTLVKVLESKRGDIHKYLDVRVRGWVYYQ